MTRAVRLTLRLIRAGIVVFLATLIVVVGYTLLLPMRGAADLRQADVIICLGGGADGLSLDEGSTRRAEHCADLYLAGVAARLHFTGRGPSDMAGAEGMAALARSLGVPASAITIEDASSSTLQNALFSRPMLAETSSSILVSDAFHLPRSWASFRALGYHDIQLSPSARMAAVRFEVSVGSERIDRGLMLVREALAIWFNAGRLTLWYVMTTLDGEDHHEMLA